MAISITARAKFAIKAMPASPDKLHGPLGLCLLLVMSGGLSGCANRAYNDLYIENMAAEIRELEDQLYEFDHEYALVEQELAAVLSENSRLRQQLGTADAQASDANRSSPEPTPSRRPVQPDPALLPDIDLENGVDSEPQSILENDSPPTQPGQAMPSPAEELPQPGNIPGADEFDPNSLVPPEITPGEIMPPQPAGDTSTSTEASSPGALALMDSRIDIPAQLASRRTSLQEPTAATESDVEAAPVTDRRVVEIGFHPSLSRAANFDDEPSDDGLVLLLQPLNQSGQMVPVAADLSVVILDPARDVKIGRWDFSTEEVESKLQPIGTNQGISLTLPWSGPGPEADRVWVFVRYTFTNGRQVVGEKEIFVSGEAGFPAVWAPRAQATGASLATTNRGDAQATTTVTTAGHVSQPAGVKRAGSNVIRPASGSIQAQPAPMPTAAQSSPWSSR